MPHHRHQGVAAPPDEAPSPRPSAAGCYAFLTRSHRAAGGYRRLDSASARVLDDEAAAVRVEVGTTRERAKSVFHVDPAVLEAGPVRRLLAAAGRRAPGGGVAVAVDVLLFEHLLWLATKAGAGSDEGVDGEDDSGAADDLSEIVEFYSQDDDDDHHHGS
ncbi:hypothetical protein GQ55_2G442600 [Panicum hallii var. hallii]|uniref:Uncharacterized protein n=1 Tax=Panicum hallii var. hallii TaxID=1504633 RepID=A0A2T7EYW9_9POAL|nr:hypothetical protein GQ55_2G442600 [Panicum hallii var. hallii]